MTDDLFHRLKRPVYESVLLPGRSDTRIGVNLDLQDQDVRMVDPRQGGMGEVEGTEVGCEEDLVGAVLVDELLELRIEQGLAWVGECLHLLEVPSSLDSLAAWLVCFPLLLL